ncbi:hypothetical protein QJS04_geneDACA012371 [Acorus gramineus]|uniref:Uncharacterized protein n=1 Tax=Acorus gramineus TaxID=55184 RepID=A0AAV9BBT3_ACOGR|nr:hypothetical protein QJS04_geneDACA012371 [Acorus gramineus]
MILNIVNVLGGVIPTNPTSIPIVFGEGTIGKSETKGRVTRGRDRQVDGKVEEKTFIPIRLPPPRLSPSPSPPLLLFSPNKR